jgi:hypothetical protein
VSGLYHYIESEPGLFTVGTGTPGPGGDWEPDSDHSNRRDAAHRAAELNGLDIPEACNCTDELAGLRKQVDELAAAVRTLQGTKVQTLDAQDRAPFGALS